MAREVRELIGQAAAKWSGLGEVFFLRASSSKSEHEFLSVPEDSGMPLGLVIDENDSSLVGLSKSRVRVRVLGLSSYDRCAAGTIAASCK